MLIRDYYISISNIGLENQTQQLILELIEFLLTITKNGKENIIEEMADVQVMVDQFFECKLQKVKRQLARIEEEKKNGKIS